MLCTGAVPHDCMRAACTTQASRGRVLTCASCKHHPRADRAADLARTSMCPLVKQQLSVLLIVLAMVHCTSAGRQGADTQLPAPFGLQIEHMRAGPSGAVIGVDTPAPRVDWRLQCTHRGQRQSRYRVRVYVSRCCAHLHASCHHYVCRFLAIDHLHRRTRPVCEHFVRLVSGCMYADAFICMLPPLRFFFVGVLSSLSSAS
jgi:hypothetical protein